MTTINCKESKRIIDNGGVTIIDARTPEEYRGACLEESINIDFLDKEFSPKIEKLPKNAKYLVYCGSGGRSAKACELMDQKGFSDVFNLEGGITAWVKEDLPVFKK